MRFRLIRFFELRCRIKDRQEALKKSPEPEKINRLRSMLGTGYIGLIR